MPLEDEECCRICFAGEEEGPLLSAVCACSGTNGHVHASCLMTWKRMSGQHDTCRTCHQPYKGEALYMLEEDHLPDFLRRKHKLEKSLQTLGWPLEMGPLRLWYGRSNGGEESGFRHSAVALSEEEFVYNRLHPRSSQSSKKFER